MPTARTGPAPTVGPLIDAAELDRVRRPGRPVILDVRWTLAGSDPGGYAAARLPGAVYVDLDRELAGPAGPGGRHPLPEPQRLLEVWRAAGIDDGAPVVVYDGGPGLAAARAWWLLRDSGVAGAVVLDGGLPAWLADPARPVDSGAGPPGRRRGGLGPGPAAMPVVDIERVAAAGGGGKGGPVLLDARAAPRFRGEVEPLDPVAGHIPGAVNLPASELMTADGRYRPAAELAELFANAGVRRVGAGGASAAGAPGPIAIASCGSGVTACQIVLAGAVIGLDVALYPGSYSQWCAAGREVAVGG